MTPLYCVVQCLRDASVLCDRGRTEPCTQAEYPTFGGSMGLTQVAAGIDATPRPASQELRLQLDEDEEISSPADVSASGGTPQQRPTRAAPANAQPRQSDTPAQTLSEQAQEQPQAAPVLRAAAVAGQGESQAGPAKSAEVPTPEGPKPAVVRTWQTPLSSFRAMLAARMHGRRSIAKPAQAPQAATPPPDSLPPADSLAAKRERQDVLEITDTNAGVTAVRSASAESSPDQHDAEPSELAGSSAAGLQGFGKTGAPGGTCRDRPEKRRRSAREVVCEFFGLQDNNFAESAP